MSVSLLSCPFCGGEATVIEDGKDWFYPTCRSRECPVDWTDHYFTEAEAIEAWNSRAERTCNLHGEWKRISQTQEVRHLYCDCGEYLGGDKRNLILECKADLPNYCPNCGARVVA